MGPINKRIASSLMIKIKKNQKILIFLWNKVYLKSIGKSRMLLVWVKKWFVDMSSLLYHNLKSNLLLKKILRLTRRLIIKKIINLCPEIRVVSMAVKFYLLKIRKIIIIGKIIIIMLANLMQTKKIGFNIELNP